MSARNLKSWRRASCVIAGALLAAPPSWVSIEAAESQLVEDSYISVREARLVQLVTARSFAIQTAFGDFFSESQDRISIKLVSAKEPDYVRAAPATYDPVQHTLIFRRSVLNELEAEVPRWIVAYWPYYQSAEAQEFFPIVAIVDLALWNAHLQQAAQRSGLTWPHPECQSTDIALRLGCEMLAAGIYQSIHSLSEPIFNANRVDRIWPENLQELRLRAWSRNSREYQEVRRLGGRLLLRALVGEFGVTRVAAYVAQTPFRIEHDNVRLSAQRYQERARGSLRCPC